MTDISATELFAKLSSAQKPHDIIDFPRKDANGEPLSQLAIVLLSQEEIMACSAGAEKTAKRLIGNTKTEEQTQGYDNIYNNALAVEMLYRACKHPLDLTKSVFPSPQSISSLLSADEIAILINNYGTMQVTVGPVVGSMSEEEVEGWLAKLTKGGTSAQYFLDLLSSVGQKDLILALGKQLLKYRMDSSSHGGQLEDTTTNLQNPNQDLS